MTRPKRGHEDATLDQIFDRLVPKDLRHLSAVHWTPTNVAIRAAGLLCASANTRVLDVGSGIGKLCTIGALSGQGSWIGVEQHSILVESANSIARLLNVSNRTTFIRADTFSLDWNEFDALYFYNPFELRLFADAVRPSYPSHVAIAKQRLESLPSYTRVVTLRGFGDVMPSSFELAYHERFPSLSLDLSMWIQRARRRTRMSM
jgi:SAM-dependent methyltransferase